jgi:hypothetical protein
MGEEILSEVFIFGLICIVMTAVIMSVLSDLLGKVGTPKKKQAPQPMLPMIQSSYPMQPQQPIPMYQQGLDPNVAAMLQYLIQRDNQ